MAEFFDHLEIEPAEDHLLDFSEHMKIYQDTENNLKFQFQANQIREITQNPSIKIDTDENGNLLVDEFYLKNHDLSGVGREFNKLFANVTLGIPWVVLEDDEIPAHMMTGHAIIKRSRATAFDYPYGCKF